MTPASSDPAEAFAGFAARLNYDDLPPEVVAELKRVLLDTLGVTLAASTLGEGVRPVVELASGGAPAQSTILAFGHRVPAPMAALANGAMAQAVNFACTRDRAHLGPATAPAAMAAAELSGNISGKELLAALAAGCELLARLASAFKEAWGAEPMKPLPTQLWGCFSAAVAAGRVLRLNPDAMHSALGLALMQASGSMQIVDGGDPPAKNIYCAFPNHDGLLSALLASRGLGAQCAGIFDGPAGLFGLFHEGRYAGEALSADLGRRFHLVGVSFKPWPASGLTHSLVEAALTLPDLRPDDVDTVLLRAGPAAAFCLEPTALRKHPPTAAAAANSAFFAVAKALANRRVVLSDFTPEGLAQPHALRLIPRMTCAIEPDLGRAGIVEVTTASGQRHVSRVDTPMGEPSRPLTWDQLVDKFLDCAGYSVQPLPRPNLDEAIDRVAHLEQIDDVSVLASLLSPA